MDINLFVNSVLCILLGFLFSKKNNHFSKEFKILFFMLGGISFISSFTFVPNNTTLIGVRIFTIICYVILIAILKSNTVFIVYLLYLLFMNILQIVSTREDMKYYIWFWILQLIIITIKIFTQVSNKNFEKERLIEIEEDILKFLKKEIPSENFYFIKNLEYIKDLGNQFTYGCILGSEKIIESGCNGIELEFNSISDISEYVKRYEFFLSSKVQKGVYTDTDNIRRLNRNKKTGSLVFQAFLSMGLSIFIGSMVVFSNVIILGI